jgi:hypothetical protein
MLFWLSFFFVAFGAKLLLALATIYLILPGERSCVQCDGETVAVRMGPAGRLLAAALRGTVERRWCPRCGWEGMSRAPRGGREPALVPGVAPGARR